LFVPFSFIAMFILIGYYKNLDNSNLQNLDDKPVYLNTDAEIQNISGLIVDAFNQVFYTMGLCMGVHYSYASYNHIKKPLI